MAYPLEIVEDLVGWMLPPACREEVLGDLYERCGNVSQYAASAMVVTPRVIWSQIRRNTDAMVFLLTACGIGFSFAAGSNDLPEDVNGWTLLRVAIPAVAALLVLLVRNGYAEAETRRQRAITLDVAAAMGVAWMTQAVLIFVSRSDLALPDWLPTAGAAFGWLFVIVLRALFPPQMSVTVGFHEDDAIE